MAKYWAAQGGFNQHVALPFIISFAIVTSENVYPGLDQLKLTSVLQWSRHILTK